MEMYLRLSNIFRYGCPQSKYTLGVYFVKTHWTLTNIFHLHVHMVTTYKMVIEVTRIGLLWIELIDSGKVKVGENRFPTVVAQYCALNESTSVENDCLS